MHRTSRVNFRVTPEQHAEIHAAAVARGYRSASAMVRAVVLQDVREAGRAERAVRLVEAVKEAIR